MKIRHLSSPEGYYAAIALPHQPYAAIEPLLYWVLGARDGEDVIVGHLVVDDEVAPADEVDGFVRYWRPRTKDVEEEYKAVFAEVAAIGYEAFLRANPHLAEAAAPQPTPSLSRKRRVGSGPSS